MICTFCNKKYSNKYNLKAHQKRTSCLKNKKKIDNKKDSERFNCNYCKKNYSSQFNLNKHLKNCKKKKEEEKEKEIKEEIIASIDINVERVVEKYKKQIKKLKNIIKQQKFKIAELTGGTKALEKCIPKSSIINNNSINNNSINNNSINNNSININNIQVINYLEKNSVPMSLEHLNKYTDKLTINHVLDKGEGLARYALDYPLKDSPVVCMDFSRRICMYKDDKEKIYKDPALRKFISKFFSSIKGKSRMLINDFLKEFKLDVLSDKELFETQKYIEIISDITFASLGEKAKCIPEFVETICSSTLKMNLLK